jgi:hypothetical protein
MKNEKEVLEMYTDEDHLRPVFKTPFAQNGYVYATDGKILIRVPESAVGEAYPHAEKPNASAVFIDTGKEASVTIRQLKKMLAKVKPIEEVHTVGKDVECEECRGFWEVTWSYERWEKDFECPVCNGSGYSSRKEEAPTGKMILDKLAPVRLVDRLFRAGYLQTIVKTMELLGIHKVVMKYNENRDAEQAIFNLNPQVDVVLMPTLG